MKTTEIKIQIHEFRDIDELPEKCGEVFKLRKFEHLSHVEISKKLNISIKTVETHMHRANTTLKEKMKSQEQYAGQQEQISRQLQSRRDLHAASVL